MTTKSIMMALGAAILAASCNKDDNQTVIIPSEELGITVTAESFTTDDGQTFNTFGVSESGMTAGLYAVSDGKVLDGYANIPLAIQSGDGTYTCHPENMENGFPENATYFIYYPYSDNAQSQCDASATTPESFFAQLAESWEIPEDQSTLENIGKSALMYASAKITDNRMSFQLKQAMSLIRLETPGIRYTFTNTSPEIPDYIIGENAEFSGHVPYSDMGRHYLIANPFAGTTLSGAFGETEWTCGDIPESGESCLVRIGNGTEVREHLLSYGDFFLSDGTLLSKDAPAEDVAAAPVVGLVFQFDPERIGSAEKEALGGQAHALVVSCKIAGGDNYLFKWFEKDGSSSRDETEIGMENKFDESDAYKSFELADNDIEGLRNNLLIRNERAGDYAAGCYPAFKAAEDFQNEAGALQTTGTTGWYLPSNGQWFDILRNIGGATITTDGNFVDWGRGDFYWENLGNIPAAMDKAMEKISQDRKSPYYFMFTYHWTSSPASETGARYLDFYDDGTAFCNNLSKSHADPIRCVLAF